MKTFVCIGHVDSGKSCLCGHLLYKCNYINDHQLDIITKKAVADKMSKWIWSRILDIDEEEQRRKEKIYKIASHFSKISFEDLIDNPAYTLDDTWPYILEK